MTLYVYQIYNGNRKCISCYYGLHADLIRRVFKIPADVTELTRDE